MRKYWFLLIVALTCAIAGEILLAVMTYCTAMICLGLTEIKEKLDELKRFKND